MNKLAAFMRDYSTARFFIPLGIILLVFGIFFFGSVQRTKNFPKTEGVVTRTELAEEAYTDREGYHEATYTVYVKYTVDGKDYETDYGVFPQMKVGDKVSVAYNPADPSDMTQPHSIWIPIGFIAGGLAALGGSAVSIINTTKKRRAMKAQEEEWAHGEQ